MPRPRPSNKKPREFQGTKVGLVYRIFAVVTALMGLVFLMMAVAGDELKAIQNYLWAVYSFGSAVGLVWMAAVVDLLDRIASNSEKRACNLVPVKKPDPFA
jgi:hypothetical protein